MSYNAKIVGILNITPDSFSDGGQHEDALKYARKLIEDGADIIDIGAESTRPGAKSLSYDEEWERLEPVLAAIIKTAKAANVKTSLDTRHHKSAVKAIRLGIDWINDVRGFCAPDMINAVKDSNVRLVMMHSLTVPADKNITIAEDKDPVAEILSWTENKLQALTAQDIDKERIILDPGIGFGKTAKQSLEIMKRIDELKKSGLEILVGHSRKSFFNLITTKDFSERDVETIAASILIAPFVSYLRVHDVAGHKRAFNIVQSLQGC